MGIQSTPANIAPSATSTPKIDDAIKIAQQIHISKSAKLYIAGGTTADSAPFSSTAHPEFTLLQNVSYDVSHPKSRIDHGGHGKPVYVFGPPDVTLRFSLTSSRTLLKYIEDRGKLQTDAKVLHEHQWYVLIEDQAGTDKWIGFNGILDSFGWSAAPQNSAGVGTMNCSVTVTDGEVPPVSDAFGTTR